MIITLELGLPAPPTWILDQINHCVQHRDLELHPTNVISHKQYGTRTITKDKIAYPSRFQKRYLLKQDVEAWISDLTGMAMEPTLAINEGSSKYHGPHVDSGRPYALTYMIETGGDNVLTSWWIKADKPMIIEDTGTDSRYNCGYDDQLTLLHQIKMQPGKWYLYNTRILHSVEGCVDKRISLQMTVTNPTKLLAFATVDQ